MNQLFRTSILFIIATCSVTAFAQDNTNYGAKEYLRYKDYSRALVELLKVQKQFKDDTQIMQNIGLCYLNIEGDKTRAMPYLKKVYNAGKYKDELLMYLGLASMHEHNFDEAIEFFERYSAIVGSTDEITRYISNCENAKALMKTPENVEFVNLGKNINTPFPDYFPFVTKNQDVLYFTSGRSANAQKIESSEGYFTTDIYYSEVLNGEWTKAKGMGKTVNTVEDEQCVYISPDGSTMVIYMDNQVEYGDLLIAYKPEGAKTFSIPKPFDEPVNSKSMEKQGTITSDGSRLIVSSDRLGGLGGSDLYLFKKLPNGNWGLPINLGDDLNTKYNEEFPAYDEATSTLYFASQGHTSMGGYDIFKSKFDVNTQTFGPVVNMGYPVNTTHDNYQFTLAGNNRDGYISTYRPEGLGDLDIYKVVFKAVETKLSVIKGFIATTDSVALSEDAYISLIDVKTDDEINGKNLNPSTGKYVFAVTPGIYLLKVNNPGYVDYQKLITVYDKSDYVFEIENNILLHRPDGSLLPGSGPGKILVKEGQ